MVITDQAILDDRAQSYSQWLSSNIEWKILVEKWWSGLCWWC